VARFVGLDRGLKRLSLSNLSDLSLEEPDRLPDGTPARGRPRPDRVVFVDKAGNPVGRLGADGEPEPVGAIARPETSLRDALSLIMTDNNRPLVVAGDDGLLGLARIEVIAGALANSQGGSSGGGPAEGGTASDEGGA
jgi:hypothetical protein